MEAEADRLPDPFGQALADYLRGCHRRSLLIRDLGAGTGDRRIPVRWLFRDLQSFSAIDHAALAWCRGRVLDLGAGAGALGLVLQNAGLEICAVDSCARACEVMRERGLRTVRHADLFDLHRADAETLLMLMDGVGIVGTLEGLDRFLRRARHLVAPGGQILLDSVDFDRPAGPCDGYRETRMRIEYRDLVGAASSWLTVGPRVLGERAREAGWSARVVKRGSRGQYLARLVLDSEIDPMEPEDDRF